mgnify:CR=1 FL=1
MKRKLLENQIIIRLMKVSLLQILLAVIFAGGTLAHPISAQELLNRKVNIKTQNEKIRNVLIEIEHQASVKFAYRPHTLPKDDKITLDLVNEPLSNVLEIISKQFGIRYEVVGQQIILTPARQVQAPNKHSSLVPATYESIDRTVAGRVTDENGDGLPGVNILIKGTQQGTVSDADGSYRISIPDRGEVTLVFSFVGYVPQEAVVGNRSNVDVTLQVDQKTLDELVVVGYGTAKAATITGSITSVKGDVLNRAPVVNLSNSMAGRLPGLVVVTRSGQPGSDGSTFRIRGANTLGDNSPLIVVDGVPNRGLERLMSSDIESVTVLKDASAAIYGAQAANGVILITTKKGKMGKPQFTITHNQAWSMPTVIPETADAATYLQMLNEIYINDGQAPRYTEEEIQNYREGKDPWLYPNTNWYDATFRNAAPQRMTNASISGGQEALSYFVSVGTNFQDAIYKNSATYYKQNNYRVNLDGQLSKHIRYGIRMAGREENRNYPTRSASDIFSMLRRGKPNMHAYWPNGLNGPDIEYGNNPVVVTTNQTGYDRNKTTVLENRANIDIQIPWVKGLSVTASAALDRTMVNDKLWRTPWYLYSWDRETYDADGNPVLTVGQKGFSGPELQQDMADSKLVTMNSLLNYEKELGGKHYVKAMVGVEKITGNSMNFFAFRKYFVSTALDELFAGGDAEKNNGGGASVQARLNYFGRVNYDFANKYLFEFVWRYDGSYIFPRDKRFGFFPGVSLGWRVSEENFWQGLKGFANDVKLRGSWGQTGNDRIDTYQYLASYGFGTAANNIYVFNENVESKILTELRIPNRNVTWEVANQSNIGMDASFINNKLTFSAEYFYNYRTSILWNRNASVPSSSGLTLPRENIGEVVNRGSEFQLAYRDNVEDFTYSVSLNFSFNKNRIKFWDETPGVPEYQKSTGKPMNTALYYKAIGIFADQAAVDAYPHWAGAKPGDIIFEDVNQDGKIDGLDRVRIEKTDLPTHTGGFNVDLGFKGLYASMFFQWATGTLRNDYYEFNGETGNYLKRDAEGRWTPSNPNASKPRPWNRYSEYWRNNQNTYWLQNSDYLRLKNFEFGYNIPSSLCQKLWISNAQIYFTGQNLLTFTKVKDFDPEVTSATGYPLNKVYNLGISLTF